MKTLLNVSVLRKFIRLATLKLEGEWLLVGGTVLPLLDRDYRSTTDIDFVPVGNATTDQTLLLMEICEELGLPVETVNGAAAYFVRKIPDFRKHLVELSGGKRARVFRPDAYLYLRLKIGRMSETDLTDCLEMLRLKKAELSPAEKKELTQHLLGIIPAASGGRLGRLHLLSDAIAELRPRGARRSR